MTSAGLSDELSRLVLPPVQFDGLSLEVRDVDRMAAFWGDALQGAVHVTGDGRARIDPGPQRPRREIVRLTRVARPSPATGRVHLDVRLPGPDPEPLIRAGARIVRPPGADPWYVLADPEDNAFCAYPAVDARPPGIFELVVKCRDARFLAGWWCTVLGGEVSVEGEAVAVTGAHEFPWDYMLFDPVPEPKSARNRMHWHVVLRDREPSALTAAGARVVAMPSRQSRCWVMADPEGNEFCACPPDVRTVAD